MKRTVLQGLREAITDSIVGLWEVTVDFKSRYKHALPPPFYLRIQTNKVVKARLREYSYEYRYMLIQKPRIEKETPL